MEKNNYLLRNRARVLKLILPGQPEDVGIKVISE